MKKGLFKLASNNFLFRKFIIFKQNYYISKMISFENEESCASVTVTYYVALCISIADVIHYTWQKHFEFSN